MKSIVLFDIDGVIRDVAGSYRRAIADTVEYFTNNNYRPTMQDIDNLKAEGKWNNDWEASQEFIYRYFEGKAETRENIALSYEAIVDFFQRRYRGNQLEQPELWDGYITTEPLLVDGDYFERLTANGVAWGFVSGATRRSAQYILEYRLGLTNPVLIAMEDAPGKPDPTGLLLGVQLLEEKLSLPSDLPIFYVGDTVADIMTIINAQTLQPERNFTAIGVLPPHIQTKTTLRDEYREKLLKVGAQRVINTVRDFLPFE